MYEIHNVGSETSWTATVSKCQRNERDMWEREKRREERRKRRGEGYLGALVS